MDSTQIDFSKYKPILDQYKIFVWDFDYTLLKIHAYAQQITKSQVESLSWHKLNSLHFADPIFFRDLVAYLIKENKKVAIISFGTYNVIKAYLDRLFGGEPIFGLHNIYTPLEGNRRYDATLRPSSNKNQYLIDLVRGSPGTKYSEVIMFDDSLSILDAAKTDLGIETVGVEKGTGFTRRTMDSLLQELDEPVEEVKEIKKEKSEPPKDKELIEGFQGEEDQQDTDQKEFDLVEGFNKVFHVSDWVMNWVNILALILIAAYWYF